MGRRSSKRLAVARATSTSPQRKKPSQDKQIGVIDPLLKPIPGETGDWKFLKRDALPMQKLKFDLDGGGLLLDKLPELIANLPDDLRNLEAVGFILLDKKGQPHQMKAKEVSLFLDNLPLITESTTYKHESHILTAQLTEVKDVLHVPSISVRKYLREVGSDEKVQPTKREIRKLLRRMGNGLVFNYKTNLQCKQKLPFNFGEIVFGPLNIAEPMDGINTNHFLVSGGVSCSPLHVENIRLFSLNLCLFGLKLWLFFQDVAQQLSPKQMALKIAKIVRENLEKLPKKYKNDRMFLECDSFLASKLYYAHPDLFVQNGVRVRHFLQYPGAWILTSSSVFHFVLNLEPSGCIAVNSIPPDSFFKFDSTLICDGHPIETEWNRHQRELDLSIGEAINRVPEMFQVYQQLRGCPLHKLSRSTEIEKNLTLLTQKEQLKMAMTHGLSVTTHTSDDIEYSESSCYIVHIQGEIVYVKFKSLHLPVAKEKVGNELVARHYTKVFLYADDYLRFKSNYIRLKKENPWRQSFLDDEERQRALLKKATRKMEENHIWIKDPAVLQHSIRQSCEHCVKIADQYPLSIKPKNVFAVKVKKNTALCMTEYFDEEEEDFYAEGSLGPVDFTEKCLQEHVEFEKMAVSRAEKVQRKLNNPIVVAMLQCTFCSYKTERKFDVARHEQKHCEGIRRLCELHKTNADVWVSLSPHQRKAKENSVDCVENTRKQRRKSM